MSRARQATNGQPSSCARQPQGAGIDVLSIPPRSPNLNPICERFLESVRHECLDHLIILEEQHLRRVLKEYVSYFNASRPHQGIAQRIPGEGHGDRPFNSGGRVAAMPILGGLHHDYRWAA
jgi:putative transposase